MRVKLGDVCERGTSNLKLSDVSEKNGEFSVFGASGYIGSVDFYQQGYPYVAVVKDGAGIGRAMLCPGKTSVIGTMQYLLPKDNILPKYLFYVVKYMNLEKYFTGATIPHIYFKDYKNEEFNFDFWERQVEIVSVLSKCEKVIDLCKQELQLLDKLIKARFVELFGDPVSNSYGLPEATLPDLGEFGRGVSKHRPRNDIKLLGGKYPLIQTGDVANAGLYITSYSSTYSELGLKQSKMWDKGTLCITIAANIAKTAILEFDACFPDSVVGFIANERTNNIFVHYWFSFFQAILESQAPESAQKNINLKILSELKVIVPEKRKQDQFASFVKLTDKSEFVKLVVIFCNNEDKGEHFMSTRKTIGGALGAIIVLIVAQILAQLVASLFVLVKIPEGICNIIAGIIYVGLAFVLSELFSKRLLKIKIENLGMPKFSIKAKWIIVGVLLPVIVKAVYLFFFSGKYVSSGMNSNQIFSTLSAGIAFTGIAAGFVEEMVFRGVILNLLKEKWNIKVAVLIPSVLFGLVHIIGMDFSIISSLLVLIAGTMVGIMFSMVAIESGSVWNSGIVHSLWNILIIGGGLSISEKADEYSVMTYVLDSKDFVFTGGEFGIESSIIALLGYVIVTLAAICMIKKKRVCETFSVK